MKNIFYIVVLVVLIIDSIILPVTKDYSNRMIFNVITLLIIASSLGLEKQIESLKKGNK